MLAVGVGTLLTSESAGPALHLSRGFGIGCYIGGTLLGTVLVSTGTLVCALARPLSTYSDLSGCELSAP